MYEGDGLSQGLYETAGPEGPWLAIVYSDKSIIDHDPNI